MRLSLSTRSHQVYRACKASSRRTFTSAPQRTSPAVCQICRSSNDNRPSIWRTTRPKPQQRWASQNASATAPPIPNPIPQTHYEFFPKTLSSGPPPKGPFHIDIRELRREFLQLQAVAHPDRHPTTHKARAEATSARINEAYKTLQNPLLRAQYLLSLRGIDVAEDETAKTEDVELLMEVLDIREEIENAQEEEELLEMKQVNDERIAASEEVLDAAFKRDDLSKAKEEAVRMRYWVNIKESLDGWERGRPVVLAH